ncbi:MAG: hypothetical protein C0485_09930 [Pirellula sp.]|nr:hypothetical protein [Pirellula sp.]
MARNDGPWSPLRAADWPSASARHAARHNPDDARGGGSAAERKRRERERDELVVAGLLERGRLTTAGKAYARAASWSFTIGEAVKALKRLAEAKARGDFIDGEFVPETFIAGCAWGSNLGNAIGWTQACFLPFLADGKIESGSTIRGNVFYAVRDPRIVADAKTLRRLVIETVGRDDDLVADEQVAAFADEFVLVRDRIRSDMKKRAEIGPPPLPVGKGLVSGRDENDVGALKPLFRGPV